MTEMVYQQFIAQWDALKEAIAKARKEDHGMATLEIVIIAGGLAVIAGLLIALITNTYNKHSTSIS